MHAVMLRVVVAAAVVSAPVQGPPEPSVLRDHLLITWYGNPHSARMGVLGQEIGSARAASLRRQAEAYTALTKKSVVMAYHLVAVVAQCTAGGDGKWRRRESADTIRRLLAEAREHRFKLVLDVQPGRSTPLEEVKALREFLAEPDVYLAIDPEFTMEGCEIPGRHVGALHSRDVNAILALLGDEIGRRGLPPKVLILHQFRLDMLPDKSRIGASPGVDLALVMDGFGSRDLKRASYRAVMRQGQLEFAGLKLFYRQDTNLLTPPDVLSFLPVPAVVVYQ